MTCAWCKGEIPAGARRDSKHCSKRCRQAAWRFGRGCVAAERAESPLRLAYADPPYPGLADYYRDHPDYAGEVDHRALLSRLQPYDGWALSTSARALPMVLGLCSELGIEARVAVWLRGERRVPSAWPLQSWEPVVYAGGRRVVSTEQPADSLAWHNKPRTSDPARVIGAKPAEFCWWLFRLLGAQGGDQLDDLFPGSGGVGRAWRLFQEASLAGALDVSRPGRPDTSPRGMDDGSARAARDTSPEYSPDASVRALDDGSPRGLHDASPLAVDDASRRYYATDRR